MAEPVDLNKNSWILTLASVAVVVGALYLAKGVLLPLILAALFSFLLSPVCDWLERRHVPRVAAILITVILTFTGFGVVAGTAASQMAELAPKMTQYQGNVEKRLKTINDFTKGTLGKWTRTTEKLGEQLAANEGGVAVKREAGEQTYPVRVVTKPVSPLELLGGMFGTLLEVLASTGIVIVLVLFFLARREDLRDRFIRLIGQGQVTGTTHALGDAGLRVSRYLLMLTVVNVAFGCAVGLGLHLIGLPNAMLWGILTATMKFVPYIGVWIAAAPPFLLSMAITTGWQEPVLVFSLFVLLEFVSGNFLEPLLFGHHTGVSAVAILVAAVFWSWLWGGIGLLLATPLTVCLLVLGKHVPQLAFLDILLGDEPVLDPPTRIYQRLLAGDQEEATELVIGYRKQQSALEIFDTVLIPALTLAERDVTRGNIEHERLDEILDGMKTLIDELDEGSAPTAPKPADESAEHLEEHLAELPHAKPRILCVTAPAAANEIIALMIDQLARVNGFLAEHVSPSEFEREGFEEQMEAEFVCISAMPPSAVTRIRQIYRRAHREFTDAKLVVGLWDFKGDVERARDRIGCSNQARIATSLQSAFAPLMQKPSSEPDATVESAASSKSPVAVLM